MAVKFTNLNHEYGMIHYPITLEDLKQISLELPKTERKYYEYAIKSLSRVMNPNEKILHLTSADSVLLKTGFIVVAENNLIFVNLKFGLTGAATTEVVKYKDIRNVDFDIAPNLFGAAQMELGILLFETKKVLGSKKRTIRNIPERELDKVVQLVRERAGTS